MAPDASDFPIRRNTALIAACLATLTGMIQLAVAVGTTALVLVTGVSGILGLGPAIFLTTGALAAFPAGRAMDRYGRMRVVRIGFAIGILAGGVLALGCALDSSTLVIVGLGLIGATQGTVTLARAATADMYPPERRARSISYALFGAVVGAAMGPLVWRPIFAGRDLTLANLVIPWLIAAAMMAAGLAISLLVRPDPRTIGEALGYGTAAASSGGATEPFVPAAPLGEIVRRPGVLRALVAAVTSFALMVSVMNLSGAIVIGHHHSADDTFWVISAHIVGMYGLVLVVGDLIDRLGRRFALVGGLAVMAVSCLALAWVSSVVATSIAMFGLGLGWVFSYVAATSELVDLTALSERGRMVGFADLGSGLTGAALALSGGALYDGIGVGAVAYGAAALAVVPAVWMLLEGRRPRAAALEPAG